jgi:hypothetical protein
MMMMGGKGTKVPTVSKYAVDKNRVQEALYLGVKRYKSLVPCEKCPDEHPTRYTANHKCCECLLRKERERYQRMDPEKKEEFNMTKRYGSGGRNRVTPKRQLNPLEVGRATNLSIESPRKTPTLAKTAGEFASRKIRRMKRRDSDP